MPHSLIFALSLTKNLAILSCFLALPQQARPPTFRIFANATEKDIGESYMRYLRNNMRKDFGMEGMGIRISVTNTAKDNPFGKKRKKRHNH